MVYITRLNIIYHNLILKFPNDYEIFRTTEAFTKYPIYIKNPKISIYGDYSPEKFYFLNKILINWTLNNHKEENQYIYVIFIQKNIKIKRVQEFIGEFIYIKI